jgi:heme oxygenase (mycobilin-producing)
MIEPMTELITGPRCRASRRPVGALGASAGRTLATLRRHRRKVARMSVVRINAITVPKERGEELERRFAARAGEVSKSPGFEAFELLRPTDERDTYLVYTRWASQADFDNWLNSTAFQHGHRAHSTEGPVSNQSDLWSFDVVQHEDAPTA